MQNEKFTVTLRVTQRLAPSKTDSDICTSVDLYKAVWSCMYWSVPISVRKMAFSYISERNDMSNSCSNTYQYVLLRAALYLHGKSTRWYKAVQERWYHAVQERYVGVQEGTSMNKKRYKKVQGGARLYKKQYKMVKVVQEQTNKPNFFRGKANAFQRVLWKS